MLIQAMGQKDKIKNRFKTMNELTQLINNALLLKRFISYIAISVSLCLCYTYRKSSCIRE